MAQTRPSRVPYPQISTGVAGLNTILHGGLSPGRICMVDGIPGCGKADTPVDTTYPLPGRR